MAAARSGPAGRSEEEGNRRQAPRGSRGEPRARPEARSQPARAPARRPSEPERTASEPERAEHEIAEIELERAADEWRASARVFESLEGRGDTSAWIG